MTKSKTRTNYRFSAEGFENVVMDAEKPSSPNKVHRNSAQNDAYCPTTGMTHTLSNQGSNRAADSQSRLRVLL